MVHSRAGHIIQSLPMVCTRVLTIFLRWPTGHGTPPSRLVRGPFPAAVPEGCAVTSQIWTNPAVMEWSQLLLNSFRHWTGRELLERAGGPDYQAHALFQSPFAVISHGMEEDPLLNYGNQIAMELWEMTWNVVDAEGQRLGQAATFSQWTWLT